VGVDDVETADQILYFEDMIHKRPAHIVDVIDEIIVGWVRASVIMNIIRPVMTCLTKGAAGKDVDLVPFPRQRSRQFRYMGRDPTNGNGVQ
jgi:hypothetical protein